MQGVILHLAGPLQSWGAPTEYAVRPTHPHPTRSGLLGMLACCLGAPRGEQLPELTELGFTIRVDRPGVRVRDYHTVGGGYPRERTVITADGKRRPASTSTLVSNRWYLSDAAFTVAVTGPEEVIERVANAVRRPVWAPYLGRRACPPTAPLYVAGPVNDPIGLLRGMPVHRVAAGGMVRVLWVYEAPPAENANRAPTGPVRDLPAPGGAWDARPYWTIPQEVSADQCAGHGTAWISRLADWVGNESAKQ